jgi:hypothetical protein
MDQIELTHLRQELEILEAGAERAQNRIDRTLAQYGTGARPSWVSSDIAIDAAHRDRYMREARTIRRKIETLTKGNKQ